MCVLPWLFNNIWTVLVSAPLKLDKRLLKGFMPCLWGSNEPLGVKRVLMNHANCFSELIFIIIGNRRRPRATLAPKDLNLWSTGSVRCSGGRDIKASFISTCLLVLISHCCNNLTNIRRDVWKVHEEKICFQPFQKWPSENPNLPTI